MSVPSILRHSKAHRAAVKRNATAMFETIVTFEFDDWNIKNKATTNLSFGDHKVISAERMSYGAVIRVVVSLLGGGSLNLPAYCRVIKTEKVRK